MNSKKLYIWRLASFLRQHDMKMSGEELADHLNRNKFLTAHGPAMKKVLLCRLILGCVAGIALLAIGTPATAQGLLDGLAGTVQQKLKEATQGVLNQIPPSEEQNSRDATQEAPDKKNAPTAEQKPKNDAEDVPDKKPDGSSQGALDKYTRSEEQKPEPTMSKEELFESWRQQYLIDGEFDNKPNFNSFKNQDNWRSFANVLYSDYGLRCENLSATKKGKNSPEGNKDLTRSLLSVMAIISDIQHGDKYANSKRLNESIAGAKQDCLRYCNITREDCHKYDEQIDQFLNEFAAESEKWSQQKTATRQEKAERQHAEQKRRTEATAERAQALRSGQAKVENYSDAQLFYSPEGGQLLVRNPKAQPDGKIYEVFGNLERIDGNTLIVKFADKYYFIISVKEKQPQSFVKNLRIGWPLRVIGRYTSNREYTTVIGATKTAPVFEAIQLSNNF
jgi:hypothetical protein